MVGPTASQKTELAIRICEQHAGEIVNADSVQIYKRFDIGSGKPTPDERARAAHHLVDAIEPTEPIDAAVYARMAQDAIDDIVARGKLPVVCGGTFLWVRALVLGLAPAPGASSEIRAELQRDLERLGHQALHDRLSLVDPELAARLAPRDFVRVQRGLEVYLLTAKPLSRWHEEHQKQPPRCLYRLVGVRWDKHALQERIRQRAQAWLRSGWIDEVRELSKAGFRDTRAMQSVGYRQVQDFIDGKLAEPQLLDSVVRATKIYARRQRTWLRMEQVTWIDPL